MPGAPTDPPPPGRPPSAAGDEGAAPTAGERVGDLSIERTVKDDGRALILYSRDEREAT